MKALAHATEVSNFHLPRPRTTMATLYEVIEAISDVVKPGEEVLISAVVLDLIESDKIKWARKHRSFEVYKGCRLGTIRRST